MPSSAIIDVAIGIAFVYLFLGLVCSVVNEAIAAIFSLRSKNLVAGINSLFSESLLTKEDAQKNTKDKSFVQAIYEHGLIRGLFQDPPSKGTTQAIMTLDPVLETAKAPFRANLPSYIPARAFSSALVGILLPSTKGEPQGLKELREAIANLPDSPTKDAMLSLVASTGKDIEEFQAKAEKWFDDGMDRVAGWYKRRTQKFLVIIGLLVAVILNVDTVKLAQQLWNNPVEREAMVAVAQKYTTDNKAPMPTSDDLKKNAQFVTDLEGEIPFPFGWHQADFSRKGFWPWMITIAGWIITALALSLGAPFWFDTLNKFMVVRATVKPREKSPPEGSKD